jgi:hypothetical protein
MATSGDDTTAEAGENRIAGGAGEPRADGGGAGEAGKTGGAGEAGGAGERDPDEAQPAERGPAERRRLLSRLAAPAGLCAACVHLRLLASPRSVFVRCGLAATDPTFPRYPALPVTRCDGYRPLPELPPRRAGDCG